ncbi:hypothetical protein RRG08_022111 [Elysia crispata]|uniref:Uncharacterized protein n=1 Tax=Elysia crispata TaxID=231223 RepID=A0AAE0Y015_9GAST|nr:hypothetical protein RRG08_022111 [Elysia crispata]
MRTIRVTVLIFVLVAITQAMFTGNKKCRQGKQCKPDDDHTYWPPMGETFCCRNDETIRFEADPDDLDNPDAWKCVCLPKVLG